MEFDIAELWHILEGMSIGHAVLVADYDDMELQELQGTLESAGHHVPIPTLESLRKFAQSKCKRAAGVTLASLRQTRYTELEGERERDNSAHIAMSRA
eukprot:1783595-Amphidinium_carterae.1